MDKELTEQKLKEITEKIVKEFQPEKIIFFGSWVWGNPGPDSDVDLLIIKDSQKPRLERKRELYSLLFPPGVAMDILVYTPEELEESINVNRNLFIEDVVRNGKILYEKAGSMKSILPERELVIVQ